MNVKINTKEKFHEVSLKELQLTANMTAEASETLTELQSKPPNSVVLNLETVTQMDIEMANLLASLQQQWYELSYSFVICQLQPAVEKALDEAEILEMLNVAPTLSEAWDIVQMEEIERELMDGFND